MENKNLGSLVRIKEKRTFILNALCECGGEFVVDIGDVSGIFSSLFTAVSGGSDGKIKHKCRKCGKESSFKHAFPCEKSFEIGLDTKPDAIAEYVSQAFEKELEDVVGFEATNG